VVVLVGPLRGKRPAGDGWHRRASQHRSRAQAALPVRGGRRAPEQRTSSLCSVPQEERLYSSSSRQAGGNELKRVSPESFESIGSMKLVSTSLNTPGKGEAARSRVHRLSGRGGSCLGGTGWQPPAAPALQVVGWPLASLSTGTHPEHRCIPPTPACSLEKLML
jgi:hypothetical protein